MEPGNYIFVDEHFVLNYLGWCLKDWAQNYYGVELKEKERA